MVNSTSDNQVSNNSNGQDFVCLYVANERRIRAYIYVLIHDWAATDDLLQDTARVMWDKFTEFKQGTDFGAWGVQIARFHVMNYLRKQKHQALFSTELVESLAGRTESYLEKDQRCDALRQCVASLEKEDRTLIQLRYEIGVTVNDVAKRVDRGVKSVYRALNRIHYQLSLCVRRKLILEDN